MGCCLPNFDTLKLVKISSFQFLQHEVELFSGNPFEENLDFLFIAANQIEKLDLRFINKKSIRVLDSYLASFKGKQKPDRIFKYLDSSQEAVVIACIPFYVDGTLGEPDFLKRAFEEGTGLINGSKIGFCIDCVYPKKLLVSEFFKHFKRVLETRSFKKVMIFSNDTQIVMKI